MSKNSAESRASMPFWSEGGFEVPAVTEGQMREVDRLAVEEFGLGIMQMMENAGRSLATLVIDRLDMNTERVAILAGSGGNGGGGLCCARHLHNRGIQVDLVLDRPSEELLGAASSQWNILKASGKAAVDYEGSFEALEQAAIIVDALIGYSLRGAPRGRTAELIQVVNQLRKPVVSLDLPSGLEATNGERPGVVIQAGTTLTLALPKTGLRDWVGDLFLADIGIPPEVYQAMGISFEPFFSGTYIIHLVQEVPGG